MSLCVFIGLLSGSYRDSLQEGGQAPVFPRGLPAELHRFVEKSAVRLVVASPKVICGLFFFCLLAFWLFLRFSLCLWFQQFCYDVTSTHKSPQSSRG